MKIYKKCYVLLAGIVALIILFLKNICIDRNICGEWNLISFIAAGCIVAGFMIVGICRRPNETLEEKNKVD